MPRRPRSGLESLAALVGVGLAVGLSLAAPAGLGVCPPVGSGRRELRRAPEGVGGQHRRRDQCVSEWTFTDPFQSFYVDDPVCNNWADIGLPEVYADPDLASFNGAVTQTSPNDQTHYVKQAVGVFATNDAADRAFHRVVDRTRRMQRADHRDAPGQLHHPGVDVHRRSGDCPTDANWVKQEAGTDRRCFITTRKRENVLLQAKVCQSGNGGPAVNVLAGAMQNTLGQ